MNNYHKTGDGNLAALAKYEREQDRRYRDSEAQEAIDLAILDAEGKEPTPEIISWLCDAAEFAEVLAGVKARRDKNEDGDWEEDGLWWEFVHGSNPEGAEEDAWEAQRESAQEERDERGED